MVDVSGRVGVAVRRGMVRARVGDLLELQEEKGLKKKKGWKARLGVGWVIVSGLVVWGMWSRKGWGEKRIGDGLGIEDEWVTSMSLTSLPILPGYCREANVIHGDVSGRWPDVWITLITVLPALPPPHDVVARTHFLITLHSWHRMRRHGVQMILVSSHCDSLQYAKQFYNMTTIYLGSSRIEWFSYGHIINKFLVSYSATPTPLMGWIRNELVLTRDFSDSIEAVRKWTHQHPSGDRRWKVAREVLIVGRRYESRLPMNLYSRVSFQRDSRFSDSSWNQVLFDMLHHSKLDSLPSIDYFVWTSRTNIKWKSLLPLLFPENDLANQTISFVNILLADVQQRNETHVFDMSKTFRAVRLPIDRRYVLRHYSDNLIHHELNTLLLSTISEKLEGIKTDGSIEAIPLETFQESATARRIIVRNKTTFS